MYYVFRTLVVPCKATNSIGHITLSGRWRKYVTLLNFISNISTSANIRAAVTDRKMESGNSKPKVLFLSGQDKHRGKYESLSYCQRFVLTGAGWTAWKLAPHSSAPHSTRNNHNNQIIRRALVRP